MKHYACIGLLVCVGSLACAQVAETDQYYVNLPAQNPAFTGIDNLWDLQLRYRQTWSQFDNKPSILSASLFGKIGQSNPEVYRNNSIRVSDPDLFSSGSSTVARRHGIGLTVNSFKLAGYDETAATAKYAFHLPVSSRFAVSMGTSLQLLTQRFSLDELTLRDPVNDLFYQNIVQSGSGNISSFSLAFGGALYSDNFFLGFDARSIANQYFSSDVLTTQSGNPAYSVVMGKTFSSGKLLAIQTVARATYGIAEQVLAGAGIRVLYRDVVSMGVHYEHEQKLSYLVSLNIHSKVKVYYAYDRFINELRDFQAGNHEVILRLPLFNKHSSSSYAW
jgi:type IX secretion system PorP/SprF family membrane protein